MTRGQGFSEAQGSFEWKSRWLLPPTARHQRNQRGPFKTPEKFERGEKKKITVCHARQWDKPNRARALWKPLLYTVQGYMPKHTSAEFNLSPFPPNTHFFLFLKLIFLCALPTVYMYTRKPKVPRRGWLSGRGDLKEHLRCVFLKRLTSKDRQKKKKKKRAKWRK